MASRARVSLEGSSPHVGSRIGLVDFAPRVGLQDLTRNRVEAPSPKRHEVLGLLALAAGTLVALALASYDARGGRDWCGPLGATLSETLVALLGTASVLVPWALLVLAVRFFRRTVQPFRLFHGIGTLAIIGTISVALHLAFGERAMLGHLPPGGLIGETVGEIVRGILGTAGAHVLVLTALLVALVLRTRLSVVSLAEGAKAASVVGSRVARDGIVTVAHAWRQARDEDRAARPTVESGPMPRIVVPEERTESALAEVFARANASPFVAEEDGDATDSSPGATEAGVMALLNPLDSAEPAPLVVRKGTSAASASKKRSSARKAKSTPVPNDAAAGPQEQVPEATSEGEVSRSSTADALEAEIIPDEIGPETKLQIISHDDEIEAAMKSPERAGTDRVAEPAAREGSVEMPSTTLLSSAPRDAVLIDESQLRVAAERLLRTLRDYTIEGRIVEIHPGPVVTTFEFVPAAGTKLSKIARLSDDIAMSLEAMSVRIVAPIPGKGRVGFEVPNLRRQMVHFRELMESEAFQALGGALPVALGKDVVGAPYFADLATMPHLIVAGSTGSGKSVGLNVMLTSLLYKRTPDDVRLLMIDPKQVELAVYDGIPHMLLPVVTDMKKAALALRWVVDEMERRYHLFAQTGARNITTFNERVSRAIEEGRPLKGLPVKEGQEPQAPKRLPYILVVVDEFADLMMVAGKEVEAAVARLAQKARAAGIHVILATQRPSVDVITGVIKANFPARVAFKVSQKVDSRTILDQQGAEHLLGKGDMLILPPGSSDLRRVHCAYASEDEVQAVTDHWRKQGTPAYDEEILRPRDEEGGFDGDEPEIRVPMDKYEKAVALVLSSRRCSVSWVQRQLAVGYNVAARMVEKMERDGVVGPPKGPGKDREVLG